MSLNWIVIRGSGLVAFALLAAATIWGLLLSSKLLGRRVKAKPLAFTHESVGLGALLATVVHMVVLAVDEYVEFGAVELLIPGTSTWEPLATAFGVMAAYAVTVVSLSFYLKRWIGQEAWRAIHFLGFGGFVAALIHGVTAGTDTTHPAVMAMYVLSGALVAGLVAARLLLTVSRSSTVRGRRPSEDLVSQTKP